MSRKHKVGRPKGSKNQNLKHGYKNNNTYYDDNEYAPLLSPETKRGVFIIFLLALSIISILSLFDLAGVLGIYIRNILTYLFGWATWIFPLILLMLTYLMVLPSRYAISFINYFGLILFSLSFNGLLHLNIPLDQAIETISTGRGGGYLGLFLSWPLQKFMGFWATLVVLIAIMLIAVMITFNTSFQSLAEKSIFFNSLISRLRGKWQQKPTDDETTYGNDEEEYEEDVEENKETKNQPNQEPEKVETEEEILREKSFATKKIDEQKPLFGKKYKKIDVPLDLLADQKEKPTAGDIKMSQERIHKTLQNFGIEVEMGEVSVGPTVTQYTLKPSEGVKLSQITTLHNDLALALAAHPIRIEAPIPGKSYVGIEVPNQTIATVGLKEVLSSKEFATRKSNLSVALGKDVAGSAWVANLDTMPHLLIAGATGSGKTVCVNSIITSLLYQNSPNTLRMILVDPKRVEMPVYNGIPHLMTPVITDVKKTINALKWTISEMDRRFEILAKTGHRDIHSFNKAGKEKMPYLVIVIDELADLMQTSGAEVEGYIIRLAQLARATGIHLVLATQRPSVDVITGLIKANITSRIAFAVASGTDSRTILDHAGAEKLLGRGDMLFISANLSKPKRIQGVFVSDDEIRRIVEYIKGQNGEVEYDTTITEKVSSGGNFNYDEDGDELLDEAKDLVIRAGKASASYLQRRLKIGYARAARILDLLEQQGIIGPGEGAKPREILVSKEDDYPDEEYSSSGGFAAEEEKIEVEELEENDDEIGEEESIEEADDEIESAIEDDVADEESEEPKKTKTPEANPDDNELI
ncbi:MAG: DNA translocase FtsK [Patescibacteria group bacterium]